MSISDRHRRIIYGILKHLQVQLDQGVVQGDDAEGISIAMQCLSAAYGVELTDRAHRSQYDIKETLEEMFSKVAPVSDVEKAEALKQQGNTHLKLNKFQEAVDCYSRAIDLDPRNATYFCNRAAAYIKLQKLDEGLEDCKRAVFLNPSYARAYGRMGYVYSSQNKLRESRDSFKKAIELDPDNENYKTNLQTVEEQLAATGPGDAAPGASSQGPQPGAGGIPNIGIPGLGSFLSNPGFMNMATNLMQTPAFQEFAGRMMGAAQANQQGQQGGPQQGQEQQQGQQGGQQAGQQGGQQGQQGGQQAGQQGQGGGIPGGGIPDLGAMAGMMPGMFQMAQDLQQTNPQLFDSLRQQFSGAGAGPGTGAPSQDSQSKPDGQ